MNTAYSGAAEAAEAKRLLGDALGALQEDPNPPEEVSLVTQSIAEAVRALFQTQQVGNEKMGELKVRAALSSLSQTLILLQEVRGSHPGVALATQTIAKAVSTLYPLVARGAVEQGTKRASGEMRAPGASIGGRVEDQASQATAQVAPSAQTPSAQTPSAPPASPAASASVSAAGMPAAVQRSRLRTEVGPSTETNFFVGFSGEIAEGGVFVATYGMLDLGTPVQLALTLPGGFELQLQGRVQFVRDPVEMGPDAEPGIGVKFDHLSAQDRELILRFIWKRPPMFYED
jgi:uncharacterized protein (TIGR02266 family)